jgi:hypothetical protein
VAELEASVRSSASAAAAAVEQVKAMQEACARAAAALLHSEEGESRAVVERQFADAWGAMAAAALSSATGIARSAVSRRLDDQRCVAELETEVAGLQLALQGAQRDQRTCRSSLDAAVVMKKKLEGDVSDLRAENEAAAARVRQYENDLATLDLEAIRLRSAKAKLEERLDGATTLAEESCATAAQQQQVIRAARAGLQSAKDTTIALFHLVEESATMSLGGGPLVDAKSLLRDALYDIADARRCQAASIHESIEGPIALFASSGGRIQQQQQQSALADEVGYLAGAFEKLKRIQDGCFAELQERVIMLDRQECLLAIRALLKSLDVVNSL